MIKIIDGDLLQSGADIICHQVNCQGKMNSGVAKQIRLKYPEVYEEYMRVCNNTKNPKDLLGYAQHVSVNFGLPSVFNLFAQCNYGYDGNQYTDINALRTSLERVRDFVKDIKQGFVEGTIFRIALPYKIGCVRGGADWNEVYAMIEEIFTDVDVELWRLDKG